MAGELRKENLLLLSNVIAMRLWLFQSATGFACRTLVVNGGTNSPKKHFGRQRALIGQQAISGHMKRRLTFLILLASSLLFQSYDNSVPKPSDRNEQDTTRKIDLFKKYSIKEQQEDLKLLKDALEKMHPDLYWHVTKEDFEKEYTTLLNGITSEKRPINSRIMFEI